MLCGMIALATASAAVANNTASYPKGEVTKLVVEKLNVTTLPSGIRPKRDHNKKTFSDFGYMTSSLDENQAVVATRRERKSTSNCWSKNPPESTCALPPRAGMPAAARFSGCSW